MRKTSTKPQWLLIAIFLTFFLPSGAWALDENGIPEPGEIIAEISSTLHPATLRRGENVRVNVQVKIIPGWHIYSVIAQGDDAPPPSDVSLLDSPLIEDGPAYETRPINDFDPVIGMKLSYHKGKAILYRNLKVPDDLELGNYQANVQVRFQTCSDRLCLPPEVKVVSLDYTIEEGPVRAEYQYADRSIDNLPSQGMNHLTDGGLWSFIALAALMGLASLITPCVFPMIPITVSFFSKQAEGKRSTLIKLATIFALGIILTYTGTGLLLSAIFGAGSALQLATNPYVNLVIGIVFILFAFSLMGLFEITIPGGVQGYFDQKARKLGGVPGVLLMGFTFTLTAFTCTVQFVGTMLIAAAQGEWIWPVLGMLVFSSVFAFPFFLLALAPRLIKKMQGKSGAWLGRSKVVLGVLELMASIKFLSNADLVWQTDLISRNTAILVWLILLACIIFYLVWTALRPKFNKSISQWVSVLTFMVLFILLGRGYNDQSLGSL
ncbi:MAG: hypothetical protein COB67_13225, partial [SAR324 cluster bacterium]